MPRGQRRSFTPEFKAKVVLELLTGAASQADLCRKHNLKPQLLANWKASALQRLHTLFQDDAQASQDQHFSVSLMALPGPTSDGKRSRFAVTTCPD